MGAAIPALLCAQSRPPNVSTAKATMAATSSGTLTSVRTNPACPPVDSTSATVSRPPSSSMSATTTAAPSRAKICAAARPMPIAAPVTTATFPSRAPMPVRVPVATPPGTFPPMHMPEQSPRLSGRVALVSGAAGGIGAAVVRRLTDDGAVVVGADLAPTTDGVRCDVTDERSCAAAVAHVVAMHGRLDILANVAGIGRAAAITDVDPDDWRRIIDVNLTGTFLLSQAAVPALLESTGCIVNMASVAGMRATPYNAAYCASKGGVILFTKSLAIELAAAGVRVNAVCPASVDTAFLRNFALPEGADLSLFARASSPMGRRVEADEVAAAVAYLASDDARNVSGTTLVIDGAATA
jgi:meso-butanediol dehydrogenase/(S,S)-butanediol dehydrogenase/diacetyl reductase